MRETTKHRKAFDQYFRLGSRRSLEQLYLLLRQTPGLIGLERGPGRSTLDAWSSALHWQDRILDLERLAREQDEADQIKAIRDMNDRHIKEGMGLQQRASCA